MNILNTVCYETAIELKKAELPSPDPHEEGFIWFNVNRRPILICRNSEGESGGFHLTDKKWYKFDTGEITGSEACFAPDSFYLLELMPDWTCGFNKNGAFTCALVPSLERKYEHNNAAEACAVVWLLINGHKVEERADRKTQYL